MAGAEGREEGKAEEFAEETSEACPAGHWVHLMHVWRKGHWIWTRKGHSTGLTHSLDLAALSSPSIAPAWPNATWASGTHRSQRRNR